MAIRFNPSTTPQTNKLMGLFGDMAIQEWQRKRAAESGQKGEDKRKEVIASKIYAGKPLTQGEANYAQSVLKFSIDDLEDFKILSQEEIDKQKNAPLFAPAKKPSMLQTLNPFATKDKMPFILNPKTALDWYKKQRPSPIQPPMAQAGMPAKPTAIMPRGSTQKPQYQVGQIIDTPKGKVKITGFDKDGEPLIEKVK